MPSCATRKSSKWSRYCSWTSTMWLPQWYSYLPFAGFRPVPVGRQLAHRMRLLERQERVVESDRDVPLTGPRDGRRTTVAELAELGHRLPGGPHRGAVALHVQVLRRSVTRVGGRGHPLMACLQPLHGLRGIEPRRMRLVGDERSLRTGLRGLGLDKLATLADEIRAAFSRVRAGERGLRRPSPPPTAAAPPRKVAAVCAPDICWSLPMPMLMIRPLFAPPRAPRGPNRSSENEAATLQRYLPYRDTASEIRHEGALVTSPLWRGSHLGRPRSVVPSAPPARSSVGELLALRDSGGLGLFGRGQVDGLRLHGGDEVVDRALDEQLAAEQVGAAGGEHLRASPRRRPGRCARRARSTSRRRSSSVTSIAASSASASSDELAAQVVARALLELGEQRRRCRDRTRSRYCSIVSPACRSCCLSPS